jgi:multidrug efflux pump subunit AcrA (membrane-fusion protein)
MEIKKGKLPGVVYLPTRAINVKVDSTFVYVVKENGFLEGRYVELGEEIGDLVVIKSGLDGTEEVAVKE